MVSPFWETPLNADRSVQDDPDYILIKAWLDEDLQDELFRHTRRIQEMESDPEREAEDDDRQDFLSDRDGGYHPPVCDELGRSLSDDINLKPSVLKQSVDRIRVHPSHREYAGKVVDVVGSQISGFGKAILYRARNEAEELGSQFSWIYVSAYLRNCMHSWRLYQRPFYNQPPAIRGQKPG